MAYDRLQRALDLNAFAVFNNPPIDQLKKSVRMKAMGNLSVTASGSGAGKTLTATGNGAFSADGISGALNDRVLVPHQSTGANNGVYKITTLGDGSNPYVLTRAVDFDGSATGGSVTAATMISVEEGDVSAGTTWMVLNANPITIDTTALVIRNVCGRWGVFGLTDGANIATNRDLAKQFKVTLAGNRTMDAPTGNLVDGMFLVYTLTQDGTGSRTITFASGSSGTFAASASCSLTPTLSTGAGKTDYVVARWNAAASRWVLISLTLDT
jgi:hypothetical protein